MIRIPDPSTLDPKKDWKKISELKAQDKKLKLCYKADVDLDKTPYSDKVDYEKFFSDHRKDKNAQIKHAREMLNNKDKVVVLKQDLKVMCTENINFEDGLVNGSLGTCSQTNDQSIMFTGDNGYQEEVKYYSCMHRIRLDNYIYYVKCRYLPFKQANAFTIHKIQGATVNELIVDCKHIWEKGQMYVALSRCTDPKKIQIRNFTPNIKTSDRALDFVLTGKRESYIEQKLIDDDHRKMNSLFIKSDKEILNKNCIYYDFETATYQQEGHRPYYNFMVRYLNGEEIENKELIHYLNSEDVADDTFEYIMQVVIEHSSPTTSGCLSMTVHSQRVFYLLSRSLLWCSPLVSLAPTLLQSLSWCSPLVSLAPTCSLPTWDCAWPESRLAVS